MAITTNSKNKTDYEHELKENWKDCFPPRPDIYQNDIIHTGEDKNCSCCHPNQIRPRRKSPFRDHKQNYY